MNQSSEHHLILGGARSGKSSYAEKCALSVFKEQSIDASSSLSYIATATAGDEEMAQRIAHHQQRRNNDWQLIEEPLGIGSILSNAKPNTTILIDCLTLWLSNCLYKECWEAERDKLLSALNTTQATVIMVSNEVGSGIVPMGELSRQFVDESGWLHQRIAEQVPLVSLVVAGLPLSLKGSSPSID